MFDIYYIITIILKPIYPICLFWELLVIKKHKTMEYFRTQNRQIQADYARRFGIILKQYREQIISTEKYEVSLTL